MRILVLAYVLLIVTACSISPPASPDWEARKQQVSALEDWEFKGRMAVKVADNPDASGQLNVLWEQSEDVSRVRLSGPFGAGAWELLWEPELVSISDADGERAIEYTGPEAADDFMRSELG